ncbi:AMP-binding protein [Imbroritus primus]|uniref:AMP-binding protein n=1 Tax=Imbroritus primus TaxID=3058603 RepID=A0ACD3SU35_9BURK|nr:AMP-binding protein [Burkholderiaceae bacterium PBA]
MNAWLPLTHLGLPCAPAAPRTVAWRGGQPLDHADFRRRIGQWHAAFAHVPGDRVALYFDDAYEFACALYGAWHAGKTVLLPGDTQPGTLARLVPQVSACAGQLPQALMPAEAGEDAGAIPLAPLSLQATRLAVYTSGSSGEPVPIMKTLAQLDTEVQALRAVFTAGNRHGVPGMHDAGHPPARILTTVSHQHLYGLLFGVLWPLAAGRPFVTERIAYPESIVTQLRQHPACWLVSSPTLLSHLPDHLDRQTIRERLHMVFSSGGPLLPGAAMQCRDLLGQAPAEIFGSSETGGIAWRRRADHGDTWNPLPGVQWRIQDTGLLEIRSPYLGDATDWWTTADKAEPVASHGAADGVTGFVLKGRADRIAKIAEKRVSLTALETALSASTHVARARAVILPASSGHTTTTRIGMVVELSASGWQMLHAKGKRAMNAALRDRLMPMVERVALPRQWRYVVRMPLNAQGKTTDAQLQLLFRPGLPPAQWLSRTALQAQVQLDVRGDLLVFDGHFPGAALVPGVAQLHWAEAFARQCFTMPVNFRQANTLKFQLPIVPGARVTLDLDWQAEQQALRFVLHSAAGRHAAGTLLFGDAA